MDLELSQDKLIDLPQDIIRIIISIISKINPECLYYIIDNSEYSTFAKAEYIQIGMKYLKDIFNIVIPNVNLEDDKELDDTLENIFILLWRNLIENLQMISNIRISLYSPNHNNYLILSDIIDYLLCPYEINECDDDLIHNTITREFLIFYFESSNYLSGYKRFKYIFKCCDEIKKKYNVATLDKKMFILGSIIKTYYKYKYENIMDTHITSEEYFGGLRKLIELISNNDGIDTTLLQSKYIDKILNIDTTD